jgi:hypothetical protein
LPSRNHASRPWRPRPTISSASSSSDTSSLASASDSTTGSALFLAAPLLAGPAEELAPPLSGAQPLGQLITPRLAQRLVLDLVDRPRLGQDLPGDLLEAVIDLRAGPAIRVPSIDTTPGLTRPARSHNLSTPANRSASARSWRQMNRAIVA